MLAWQKEERRWQELLKSFVKELVAKQHDSQKMMREEMLRVLTLLGDIFCYSTSDDFFCYSKCSYCWFVCHPLYERCVARSSAVVYVARIKCFFFHPHTFTVLSRLPVARRPSSRTATQHT